MILAILSTLTVLATVWTLTTAIRDRRAWIKASGYGTAEAMIGFHAVTVELLRIFKHLLLTASVWSATLGHPRPWLATTACITLGGTSLVQRYFRRQTQRRIQQERRVAALKASTTPPQDRPKP